MTTLHLSDPVRRTLGATLRPGGELLTRRMLELAAHVFVCCAVLALLGMAFADDAEPKSPWDFSVTTDFAYYPKSDAIP